MDSWITGPHHRSRDSASFDLDGLPGDAFAVEHGRKMPAALGADSQIVAGSVRHANATASRFNRLSLGSGAATSTMSGTVARGSGSPMSSLSSSRLKDRSSCSAAASCSNGPDNDRRLRPPPHDTRGSTSSSWCAVRPDAASCAADEELLDQQPVIEYDLLRRRHSIGLLVDEVRVLDRRRARRRSDHEAPDAARLAPRDAAGHDQRCTTEIDEADLAALLIPNVDAGRRARSSGLGGTRALLVAVMRCIVTLTTLQSIDFMAPRSRVETQTAAGQRSQVPDRDLCVGAGGLEPPTPCL